MAIQIVRFKDGLDVITDTKFFLDCVELKDPMIFQIKNNRLVLQQWLPMAVIKNTEVTIDKSEVLCTMDPKDDFKDYYVNAVEDLHKELSSINNQVDDHPDIMDALEELSNKNNINIH